MAPVIIKRSRNRFRSLIGGLGREADLYSWPDAPQELLPKVFATKRSMLGDVAICMEDLIACGGERLGLYLFNQGNIWGPRPLDKLAHKVSPLEALRLLFQQTAVMHARYWNQSSLRKLTWLKGIDWTNGFGQARWQANLDYTKLQWALGKQLRGGALPAQLIKRMDESLQASTWEAYQSRLQREPFTLCHGDFHAGNIMFMSGQSFKLYDWSECCLSNPLHDLAQLLISDVPPDFVRQHALELIVAYHGALGDVGVGVEQCWWWLLEGGGSKWVHLLSLMASMRNVSDAQVAWFADNLLAWMELADEHLPGASQFPVGMLVKFT